mgnify:FL=1
MTAPLVSIVIPAYNHCGYLREAIESVLAQTYRNVELIVIDDGSTDDTQRVLEAYGERFYWESQENMGQSRTLNKGWGMAKGDILAYLSADDVLMPDAVAKSVACLQQNPDAVLSYCNTNFIDPQSRVIRGVTAPDYSYHDMVATVTCPTSTGAFFLRSAFSKTGGWDPQMRHHPDYDCWLRLGLHGRFVHIDETLGAFRIHGGSQSFSQTSVETAEEMLRIMTKFYALPQLPADILLARNEAFAGAHLLVAQLHLRAARYLPAMRELRAVARHSLKVLISLRCIHALVNGLFNRYVH